MTGTEPAAAAPGPPSRSAAAPSRADEGGANPSHPASPWRTDKPNIYLNAEQKLSPARKSELERLVPNLDESKVGENFAVKK